jgi:hypothetical protein
LSSRRILAGRSRRHALGALALALCAFALALLLGPSRPGATSRAAGPTSLGEVTAQTDASVPATRVTMFGAAPKEAKDETWGIGQENGASVLVRYTPETGWTLGPGLLQASGQPLSGFELDKPEASVYGDPSPLAGQMTAYGSGVLAGTIEGKRQVLLVRNPGGAFQETAALPTEGEAALQEGEGLFGVNRAPMIAAIDETSGLAGALVVPVDEEESSGDRVLHWNGTGWTSERIEVPAESKDEFQVLAIGASSPENAWLIAKLSSHYPAGSVALFRRHVGKGGEATTWQPVKPTSLGEPGEPLAVPTEKETQVPFTVPTGYQSQVLTVTEGGLWIDGRRSDVPASTTMFFKPEGEDAGHVTAAWCTLPADAPKGTEPCPYPLPEAIPTAHVRSFAWEDASTKFGERVITGFPDGVSLRLEGSEFKRVLALGGSPEPKDVGGSFGAAFSSSREGWLGQELLPVHLTLEPLPSRLTPWPTAFRYALLAIAPAPEQPVGSLSSEALAVGDEGEVARYEPGKGWLPESLLGPGGHHETPLLRAVAWPRPTRAYAVGDNGQMWLWRGETGLWEPDPATPVNFEGNLLGIAFEPEEPERGYAVGQDGVLLSYGKTWTQEPEAAIPQQARGANFTSVAFAGSEAIVAYRKLNPVTDRLAGGLIVNDGSGWQIDAGAAAAMGANVPWVVAGLPDGGAAFSAGGASENGLVVERQSASAPWQPTPTPPPGGIPPGSLALFSEGGALRVIASGSVPETIREEDEASPPPGSPPTRAQPYPLTSNQEKGVLRQTANGWSDEEHELNNVEEPPGEYADYDTVYRPDPVAAVMVDPTGSQGWAVGGIVVGEGENLQMDTADVWRYPSEGPAPVETAPVKTPEAEAGDATFAIGGGAHCEAPCADLAKAKIGPDVWLEHALNEAHEVAGLRAFLYTGPRVSTGKTAGPATLAFPYQPELERYAEVLSQSATPVYVAASPTDLDLEKNEELLQHAFSGFPKPFGGQPPDEGLEAVADSKENCQGSEGCAYYSMNSTPTAGKPGGTVRVIVLDDSHGDPGPGSQQLTWLKAELTAAEEAKEPAIVVGNADLHTQIAAGGPGGLAAEAVAQVLWEDHASAYFFDSPEQNVEESLRVGTGSINTFGSGTLGYVSFAAQEQSDFIGASGFLLVSVGAIPAKGQVAPVHAQLIPDIGELALEAEEGTLLRRSGTALFDALARRPRSGSNSAKGPPSPQTDPYIPIPAICVGTLCPQSGGVGKLPDYEFSSSEPKIGNFVKQNLAAEAKGHLPLLNANDEPEQELKPNGESGGTSGLFCAFNPGTTIVTIKAGGLQAKLPVTVEAGSVRQPCGTVPSGAVPVPQQQASVPAPPPPPPTSPAAAPPTSAPPPVPPPPPVAVPPRAPVPATPPPPAFLVAPAPTAFFPGFVPPPVPQPGRPTPPSGTSAVEAVEREEEEESAPESVSNQAVAYRAPEHEPPPAYILGIVLLAAFAGASVRRRSGRRGRELPLAPATISAMHAQRQASTRGLRRR